MKKCFLLILLSLSFLLSKSQIIINELEADAGNNEATGGDWIEFKNIGTNPEDMSCWRLSNGGSVILSFPSGLVVPAGGYLLVGNASKMMCSTCDYKSLSNLFTLNASGFGPGSGSYSNTIFLNTDLAINGGCDCLTGSGNYNNGSGAGDRIMLFNDLGGIIDQMMYAGGSYYGPGPLNVNFPGTASCGVISITIPDASDAIFDGHKICNDLVGCNSSFARLPDGNNGAIVTYDQSGNLSCTNCLIPCVSGATNTASTDYPTPGIGNENSATTWVATLNGTPVTSATTTMAVCGATPLTFTYMIANYTNIALTATQASGNLGSYTITNGGAPVNFAGTNYSASSGMTILSTTVTPPLGTTTYEFVFGDGNANCTTCPGSNSTTVPSNPLSSESECYVSRKLIVSRENPLTGTPAIGCSLPGTITVSGMSGTNILYILEKQSATAGPWLPVLGPQASNIIAGIYDDDADPTLPNYRVVIASNNTACANPPLIYAAVPTTCLGNPVCAKFSTGAGAPTFIPGSSTVCANSQVQFNVSINGVCNTGQVEMKYDFDPLFNPYSQGTSLGLATTTVGATPPTTTSTARVYISEYAANVYGTGTAGDGIEDMPISCGLPAGADADGSSPNSGEYVELYNAGPGFIDLSGWMLTDGDWTVRIPAGTILAAGSWYLIGGGGTACITGVVPDLNVETCNCTTGPNLASSGTDYMNLTNSAEYLILLDCTGTKIDEVRWGSPTDATQPNGMALGCGNYLLATPNYTFAVPVPLSSNANRARADDGTWSVAVNSSLVGAGFNGTPKADNVPGGTSPWNGGTTPLGTQCPPPPVNATMMVNIPDTCSTISSTSVTLKAIYHPDPIAPCQASDITATATYTIPPCSILTISGNGDYCAPAVAPISISSSDPLVGNYSINLDNGVNTTSINPATGAGPFTTSVSDGGVWTIASVTAPAGICPPKGVGAATININPIPTITSAPDSVAFCYLYGFDLSSVEASIMTNPPTTHFVWYDTAVGGSPIFPYVNPSVTTTYYVAATTGLPANCEETVRTPIVLEVKPIPDPPNVVMTSANVTFYPLTPNCSPVPCASGIEYSLDGINWSAGPSFTAADPGWSGFGSPTNSFVYFRNIASPACYNYTTYFNIGGAPLPTELFQFVGKMNNNNTIDLSWKTAQEFKVSHFELEKSADKFLFHKIAEVNAKGNTTLVTDYSATDLKPYNGANYFRLKIVDADQHYVYSNVINVESDGHRSDITSLTPNPAGEFINLELNMLKNEKSAIQIMDALGRTVLTLPVLLEKGHVSKHLNVQSLAKGTYTIRIPLSNTTLISRFVKE